jgi:hypothetical protein
MVALIFRSAAIGLCKDPSHFIGIEIAQRRTGGALGRYMRNGVALCDSRRLARGGERKERTYCRQTAITRTDRTASNPFTMFKEIEHDLIGQILQTELGHWTAVSLGGETKKQAPRIPI